MNNIIILCNDEKPPENYTGKIKWETGMIETRLNGKVHNVSGPAQVYGEEGFRPLKVFWIDDVNYSFKLEYVFPKNENMIFLGKEKGRYDLEWLKFLTENGLEEFPLIPEMEKDEKISCLVSKFTNLKGEEE